MNVDSLDSEKTRKSPRNAKRKEIIIDANGVADRAEDRCARAERLVLMALRLWEHKNGIVSIE
jgi:hypothetical protein